MLDQDVLECPAPRSVRATAGDRRVEVLRGDAPERRVLLDRPGVVAADPEADQPQHVAPAEGQPDRRAQLRLGEGRAILRHEHMFAWTSDRAWRLEPAPWGTGALGRPDSNRHRTAPKA